MVSRSILIIKLPRYLTHIEVERIRFRIQRDNPSLVEEYHTFIVGGESEFIKFEVLNSPHSKEELKTLEEFLKDLKYDSNS